MTAWLRVLVCLGLVLPAGSSLADRDPFPSAGSALEGVGVLDLVSIGYFFETEDAVSETLETSAPVVTRAVFDLQVPYNVAEVPVEFAVTLNNVAVGSVSVPAMQTGLVHAELEFPPVMGPSYAVRIAVAQAVPIGQGSISLGNAGASQSYLELAAPPNHYACRQVKDQTDPKFAKILDLPLEDDLGAELVDVKKPVQICLPAVQDDSPIGDASAVLCCYQIKATKLKPAAAIQTTDEFGTHQLDVSTAKTICQPCAAAAP
jgi:hypothetical protein